MGRIDGERCQDREDLLLKIVRQVGAFGIGEIRPTDDGNSVLSQSRSNRIQKHQRMPGGELSGAIFKAAKLLARSEPVGGADSQAHLVTTLEAGDPNHVELIEIGGEDRQELGPLKQGERGVRGQRQHPCVEIQPAQLAVEVAVLRQRVVDGGRGGGRRGLRCGVGGLVVPRRAGPGLGLGHGPIIPYCRSLRTAAAE